MEKIADSQRFYRAGNLIFISNLRGFFTCMVSEMILQSLEMLKENPTGGINVKKWMIIIVLLGAVAWVISDFITNSNSDNSTSEEADSESEIEVGLDAGQLAPDFELQTVSGETVRLSDFRGEKVLY